MDEQEIAKYIVWLLVAAALILIGRTLALTWRLHSRGRDRAEFYRLSQLELERQADESLEPDDPTDVAEMREEDVIPPGKGRVRMLNGTIIEYDLPAKWCDKCGASVVAGEECLCGQEVSAAPAKPPSEQPVRCNVCRRILTGKEAIRHGQGRVCRRKAIAAAADQPEPPEAA